MDPTRRSLCGLGIASVPLAMITPDAFSAARDPQGSDPLLAYLAQDTRRQCGLALAPGRRRPNALRALAANVSVLAAYLQSRTPAGGAGEAVRRHVQADGLDACVVAVREAWPARASEIAGAFGVTLPGDLDPAVTGRAIEAVERYGSPRLGAVRRWLDAEADRIERWEGLSATIVPVRQTPGNDYGPPGWAAGSGDPNEMSCWDLELVIAAIAVLIAFQPELAAAFGQIGAILGVVYVFACGK